MTGSVSAFYSKGLSNEKYDHSSVTFLLYGIIPLLAFQRDLFFLLVGSCSYCQQIKRKHTIKEYEFFLERQELANTILCHAMLIVYSHINLSDK